MSEYHLAQLNIASMIAELDDPLMQDFVDNLEGINQLADNSPGFIWRLEGAAGDATSLRVFDDKMLLVNMSVWRSLAELKNFVYQSLHVEILRRKKEWFRKFSGVYQVLWWIEAGHIPDVEEAREKLAYLQAHGASAQAFSFQRDFPAPDDNPVETTAL